jgi:hypothetical protein
VDVLWDYVSEDTARWLSLPAMAGSVARWNRAADVVVSRPGARSLATFNAATRALATSAKKSGAGVAA